MEPADAPDVVVEQPPGKTWMDRFQALFEVILLAGLISSLLASLPFTMNEAGRESLFANVRVLSGYILLESGITFLLLFFILKAHRETLGDFGLSWQRWRSNVIWGLAIVPVLFSLNLVIALLFQIFFPTHFMDRNPLIDLIRTPQDLGIFVGTALIAGGIKEELQRAFILRRFQSHLGGAGLGLVLWSTVFGLGHYVQGAQGVIAAALFGLMFGIAYLARGSLIVPVVAHGAYDTAALLGSWFFSSPR